jgi:hypothetical protein
MEWTEDMPTRSGWYWWRDTALYGDTGDLIEVIEVDGYIWMTPVRGRPALAKHFDGRGFQFAGPLVPPA